MYRLEEKRGREVTKTSREAGTTESVEMAAKEVFEAVRDSRARTREITINRLTVSSP
jgi:hypothetical protein